MGCDITFACKDDQKIDGHRVIISASSPVLRDIIMRNKHFHPLVYMRSVNAKNMNYIIDFMYYGEVNVFQEELEGFLELAEEFKLKGLHKTSSGEGDINNVDINEDYETYFVDQNEDRSTCTRKNKMEKTNGSIHKKEHLYEDSNILVLAENDKISMENSGVEGL